MTHLLHTSSLDSHYHEKLIVVLLILANTLGEFALYGILIILLISFTIHRIKLFVK